MINMLISTIRKLKLNYPNESDFIELGKLYTGFALLSTPKNDSTGRELFLPHIKDYLTNIFEEEYSNAVVVKIRSLQPQQIIENLHELIKAHCKGKRMEIQEARKRF
ncbi:MAG: hypothetical protein IPI11_10915 [Haliscomenobacter sp.]|nr:hypothetical protein [Haliscomenobacter sp.]